MFCANKVYYCGISMNYLADFQEYVVNFFWYISVCSIQVANNLDIGKVKNEVLGLFVFDILPYLSRKHMCSQSLEFGKHMFQNI